MSYHRITVIGHAGSEPEHQVTASGKDYAYFPLYVNERYGDSERAIRYKIKTWDGLSLIVKKYLERGQLLLIEGRPSVETWQNAAGKPQAQMVVTAQSLRFLGSRSTAEAASDDIPQ